ncbi:MAG: ABC transporter ATP-binding protein, partial [Phormidesmis sp.]
MEPLTRVLSILRSYFWLTAGAALSLLLLTAANAVTPQLFRRGIDQGIAPKDLQVVLVTGAMMVGVAIARGLFN